METKIEYAGYKLHQFNDYEEDNVKTFHDIILPNGNHISIQWTPYQYITETEFRDIIDNNLIDLVTHRIQHEHGSSNWDHSELRGLLELKGLIFALRD